MIMSDGIHLVSDRSLEELHRFAHRLGLKREWYQDHRIPHYDITTYHMKTRVLVCSSVYPATTRELVKSAVRS